MNNVGDILTFTTLGTAPGSATPIYVWRFWDSSVQVSTQNQGPMQKGLNVGGDPSRTQGVVPFTLPYFCDICNAYGTIVSSISREVAVNNPPTISQVQLTNNNSAYAFETKITVTAYDLEQNGVSFQWFVGDIPVTGNVDTNIGNVPGTYAGTWIGNRTGYTSMLDTVVYSDGTVFTVQATDGDSGVSRVDIPVYGYDPKAPQFSVAAKPSGPSASASTLPDAVIAPGQTVDFSVYAADPSGQKLSFTWFLYGTNGWTNPLVNQPGKTTPLGIGYSNVLSGVDISGEATAGLRKAIVYISNPSGQTVIGEQDINLTVNGAPVIQSVSIYDPNNKLVSPTVPVIRPPAQSGQPAAPFLLRFSANASDPNNDIVYYEWKFSNLADFGTWRAYGAEVYLDVGDWSANQYAVGTVTAFDRFGAFSVAFTIPQFVLA